MENGTKFKSTHHSTSNFGNKTYTVRNVNKGNDYIPKPKTEVNGAPQISYWSGSKHFYF